MLPFFLSGCRRLLLQGCVWHVPPECCRMSMPTPSRRSSSWLAQLTLRRTISEKTVPSMQISDLLDGNTCTTRLQRLSSRLALFWRVGARETHRPGPPGWPAGPRPVRQPGGPGLRVSRPPASRAGLRRLSKRTGLWAAARVGGSGPRRAPCAPQRTHGAQALGRRPLGGGAPAFLPARPIPESPMREIEEPVPKIDGYRCFFDPRRRESASLRRSRPKSPQVGALRGLEAARRAARDARKNTDFRHFWTCRPRFRASKPPGLLGVG